LRLTVLNAEQSHSIPPSSRTEQTLSSAIGSCIPFHLSPPVGETETAAKAQTLAATVICLVLLVYDREPTVPIFSGAGEGGDLRPMLGVVKGSLKLSLVNQHRHYGGYGGALCGTRKR
jgi:hypothetical protein